MSTISSKQKFIDQEILKVLRFWGAIATGGGAVIFLSLSILDHFVTPANVLKFLVYRASAAGRAILLVDEAVVAPLYWYTGDIPVRPEGKDTKSITGYDHWGK